MTRRPKTPRTRRQHYRAALAQLDFLDFGIETTEKARRQPKGRRAKSGQWAKRTPCPVKLGKVVEHQIEAMRVHRLAAAMLREIARERGYGPVKFTTNDRSDKP